MFDLVDKRVNTMKKKEKSEYSRKNLEMFCLLAGGSSVAGTVLIFLARLIIRRLKKP